MKTSNKAQEFIKNFEGLRLRAYKCPAGVMTIGYGHTGEIIAGASITKEQAERYFQQDLLRAEGYVNSYVKVLLSQGQFDALVSFVFNIGPTNLRSSTLLRRLNAKNYLAVPTELRRWVYGNGKTKLAGLIRRREGEVEMWVLSAGS